jgi:tetratricopeptide (TPR) repeat protein
MAAMAAGRKRVDAGDLRGAIRRFDEAARIDRTCAQAVLYRAGLKLLSGDLDGAVADFRLISTLDHSYLPAYRDLTTLSAEEFPALILAAQAAVRRAPDSAWAWVFRAFSLRSLMLYDEAVSDLDRAVACEPRSAAVWAMRSRVKLTNRQAFYDGVRDMEKAVALAPDWGWLNCWLGEALRHQGAFARALKAHDKGLALEPGYLRGWAWRGGVKVALGDWRGARRDLTRSLAWDPIYSYDFEYTYDQKSWAYNQLQLASRGLGETRRALRELNEAHRFGPRYAWCFNPKGEPSAYRAAVAELEAYSRRAPRDGWAFAWRGWTLHQAGDDEAALASLRRARALSPRSAWPAAWEGKILSALGRPEEAARALSAALTRDPSYAPAWGWRGEARRRLGKLRGAAADFKKAVRLDHRAAWALAGLGEAKRGLGDLPGSLAALDRALGILPDYPEALGFRAETRRLAGDFAGALADADQALARKPGLVLVYVTRALVKQALKDYAGQLKDLRRAAQLDPSLFAEAAR